eukprot:Sdes_comp9107_c0_seq2m569
MLDITSEEEFKNIISSHEYILVQFYVNWSLPCLSVLPLWEKYEAEYGNSNLNQSKLPSSDLESNKTVLFVSVDFDKFPEMCKKYDISTFPTFFFYHDHRLKHAIRG